MYNVKLIKEIRTNDSRLCGTHTVAEYEQFLTLHNEPQKNMHLELVDDEIFIIERISQSVSTGLLTLLHIVLITHKLDDLLERYDESNTWNLRKE